MPLYTPAITALTTDVTATGPGSVVATIAGNAVTNAKLATMAANTVKANATSGSAAPTDVGYATLATAATFAYRDSNGNMQANVPWYGWTSTVSSSTPISLTQASSGLQRITGSTNQTINLPATNTIGVAGFGFKILNRSTALVTVKDSGGSNQIVMEPASQCTFTTADSGSPGTWDVAYSSSSFTASRALVSDSNGLATQSATTSTELGYVSGVTSAIQTQINGKQATGNYVTALTGDVTASGPGSVAATAAATQNNITSIPNLATVGTVTSGTWHGSTLDVAHGGTNNTAFTANAVLAGGTTSTGAFQSLANGSSGQVLMSAGSSALPTWTAINYTYAAMTTATAFSGSGTYCQLTGNSVTISTNGVYEVTAYCPFQNASSATYSFVNVGFYGANGANTSSTPSGVTNASVLAGSSAISATMTSATITQWPLVLTAWYNVTGSTTIYAVPYALYTSANNTTSVAVSITVKRIG